MDKSRTEKARIYLPITLLVLINIGIGLFTFQDYGESWDSQIHMQYGVSSLSVYSFQQIRGNLEFNYSPKIIQYGPVHDQLSEIGIRFVQIFLPDMDAYDLKYLFNFLAFQVGVISLYSICLKLFDIPTALITAVLFSSQPLLWGHAFINPKDTPFMSYFLFSIAAGLHMVEHLRKESTQSRIRAKVLAYKEKLLEKAGQKPAAGVKRVIQGGLRAIQLVVKETNYYIAAPQVLLAGFALGIASSSRVLGPYSGVLIVLLLIIVLGKRALLPGMAYLFYAFFVTDIAWPYLWVAPVKNYLAGLQTMLDVPWEFKVLFQGSYYSSTHLPGNYLPVLMGLQFTEPAVILCAAGLLIFLIRLLKSRTSLSANWIAISLWVFVPFLYFFISRPKLYDNFRHLLFITPPLFLFAGLAIQETISRLQRKMWVILLAVLILLPGIFMAIQLHPYQYLYYNAFTGGVQGAEGNFELDYWCTAFEDMTNELNRIAPVGSRVAVMGPDHIVARLAREDLQVYGYPEDLADGDYDYLIATTRWEYDKNRPEAAVIYQVQVKGATLAVLKELN